MSDTQTVGWMAPNSACTTALPRLGRITCSTASVPTNTHSHQFLPLTRAEVSSEQTTGAGEHRLADRRRRSQQRLTRTGQHVADRAFADREREHLAHQRGQPFQCRWRGRSAGTPPTPRSTGRTASRAPARLAPRRSHALAAAGAAAAEQAYLRHVRPDRRQLDAVVDLLRRLLLGGEGGGAMRAGVKPCIDDAIRVRLQRAADAGAALARRLVAGWDDRDFWPSDGGSEELSGVFGGRSNTASRCSNSVIRASAASNCPTSGSSDRMRSSFSAWLSLLRSIPCVTQSLNRVARHRVNHHRDHPS